MGDGRSVTLKPSAVIVGADKARVEQTQTFGAQESLSVIGVPLAGPNGEPSANSTNEFRRHTGGGTSGLQGELGIAE